MLKAILCNVTKNRFVLLKWMRKRKLSSLLEHIQQAAKL